MLKKFKKERIPLVIPEAEHHRAKQGKRRLSVSSAEGNSSLAQQPAKKVIMSIDYSTIKSASLFSSHVEIKIKITNNL